MEAIAEAVRTLVPSQRAFVMGGSMGGYIAMAFGARHLDLCRYTLAAHAHVTGDGTMRLIVCAPPM
jgi:pimeloyl-ACP methyl ester carboxylesterase